MIGFHQLRRKHTVTHTHTHAQVRTHHTGDLKVYLYLNVFVLLFFIGNAGDFFFDLPLCCFFIALGARFPQEINLFLSRKRNSKKTEKKDLKRDWISPATSKTYRVTHTHTKKGCTHHTGDFKKFGKKYIHKFSKFSIKFSIFH